MEMRQWGLVCIATTTRTPPDPANRSTRHREANVLRGRAVREILRTLGYVNRLVFWRTATAVGTL